ncbi:MAG: hypothetical protein E6K80_05430 [Candidatus Eisenbacteria bacterium]|uniref:Tr-type G domain-containing protein n=1 Tax=Eiseniibacteriota bacterium TaxID=2212470 RepID=A0A538U6I9_UNCEI|nr:MAG: hypothetical protein E6K80_05430 [Candidatus Eisenbacteria bacterium]
MNPSADSASTSAGLAIVGTAGHIDHGKTALVRRLTGIDTDRLPEERARGISIDLGFAPLVTPAGVRVGLVDVPGHERFVKNMLAGVGGVDAILLVIAADEGVMPQTREHLAIVQLLGVRRSPRRRSSSSRRSTDVDRKSCCASSIASWRTRRDAGTTRRRGCRSIACSWPRDSAPS